MLYEVITVLGVSSAPVYGELVWAERGKGAWLGGERLVVSDVASIAGATLSSGNLRSLARSPAWSRYGALVGSVNRIRGYGDFLHYHLLAGVITSYSIHYTKLYDAMTSRLASSSRAPTARPTRTPSIHRWRRCWWR